MRRLTVLSGPGAPLGLRARCWLRAQRTWLPVEVADPASPRLRALWPELALPGAYDELAVLDDDGRLWRGDDAWLMLLWATRSHRAEALRLGATGRVGEARLRVLALSQREPPPTAIDFVLRGLAVLATVATLAWLLAAVGVPPVAIGTLGVLAACPLVFAPTSIVATALALGLLACLFPALVAFGWVGIALGLPAAGVWWTVALLHLVVGALGGGSPRAPA